MSYLLDSSRFNIFIFISIGYAIYLLVKRKDASIRGSVFFFIIGLACLTISIIGACATESNWKFDYILAFLCFKKVSDQMWIGGPSYLRVMAYICVLGGLMQFVIALFKNIDK